MQSSLMKSASLVISESETYSYSNAVGNMYDRGSFIGESAEEAKGETVIQSAKLIVSADVSITFNAE